MSFDQRMSQTVGAERPGLKEFRRGGRGAELVDREAAGLSAEDTAELAGWREFKHFAVDEWRDLVKKEGLATITSNERAALAIVRKAKAESRSITDEEHGKYEELLNEDYDNKNKAGK